jgi:predicted MFS family arabinose efflux permease
MGVVAAIMGSAAVFFDVGYQSYLPALVADYDLTKGNARLEMSSSAAQAGGPPLAGLLIQFIGAANAIIVDSTSYLVSVFSLAAIRRPEQIPDRPRRNLWPEARQGVRIVFAHPLLSRLVITSACANLGRGLALELFILYAYRGLKFSPGVTGAVLAAGAVATMAGAALCARLAKRLGLGRSMLLSSVVKGIPWMFVPVALVYAPIAVMVVVIVASSFFLPVWNVNNVSLRQYLTDSAVLGRVSATVRTVAWATVPLSALLGGVLAQAGVALWGDRRGLATVLAVGGVLWSASVFALPIRRLAAVRTAKDAADMYGRVTAPD